MVGEHSNQRRAGFDLILPLRQGDKPRSEVSGCRICAALGIADVAPQCRNAVFIGVLHVGLMLHQPREHVVVENEIAGCSEIDHRRVV